MPPGKQLQIHHYNPAISKLPEDFSERLNRVREAAGLTWGGLSRELQARNNTVLRWHQGTAQPSSGYLFHLVLLADSLGLLEILLYPESNSSGGDQSAE